MYTSLFSFIPHCTPNQGFAPSDPLRLTKVISEPLIVKSIFTSSLTLLVKSTNYIVKLHEFKS